MERLKLNKSEGSGNVNLILLGKSISVISFWSLSWAALTLDDERLADVFKLVDSVSEMLAADSAAAAASSCFFFCNWRIFN